MNYNDELKVVWITPTRTGTRSSGAIMSKLDFKSENNNIRQKETVHGIGIPEGKEDYKLIVNIRNPYSRMVSLYYLYMNNSKQFNQSFDRWVKSNLSFSDYNKSFFILDSLKKLSKLPDLYVRMENFKNDINSLWFVKENFDFLEQTLKNNIENNLYDSDEFQSNGFIKKESWKEYYNEEISEFVYKKMKNEFDFFNYDKNSWK
jgi:hypothetical protein